jgi:hypothetical protein
MADLRFDWEDEQRRIERDLGIVHKDGVPWHEAEEPPWDHECWPQTRGFIHRFELVERCPCGGVRIDGYGPWIEVNQTRKHRGETEPVAAKMHRAIRVGVPWQIWMLAGCVIGWLIGFLPLWIFGWGPRVGGMWATVITMATMCGIGTPVGFWASRREMNRA